MKNFISQKKGISIVVGSLLLFTITVFIYIFTQVQVSEIIDLAFTTENRDRIGSQIEFLDITSGSTALVGVKKKIENELLLERIVINSTTCFTGSQELNVGINNVDLDLCTFTSLYGIRNAEITVNGDLLIVDYTN